ESRGGGAAGTGRGTARSRRWLPRIARQSAEPDVAHGKLAHGELGQQHGAGLLQPVDHGGIVVEDLILVRLRAIGRTESARGEQVFRAPWHTVQRPSPLAGSDLSIRALRLLERA